MSPRRPFRYWPVVAVVALAAALVLSNQKPTLPTGGTAITTPQAYQDALSQVDQLAVARVKSFEAGGSLTPDDIAQVRKAGDLLDGLIAYRPVISANYFLSGKIHTILGEESIAIERYRQCVNVAPGDAASRPEDAPIIKSAAARADYEISLLLLSHGDKQGAFDAADAAVKEFPERSEFLTARASALNELRRVPEAKRDLALAIKLDPTNSRAKSLLRFISK